MHLPALVLTLIVVLVPAAARAAPFGYYGDFRAFADVVGSPQESDVFSFGSPLAPVVSFDYQTSVTTPSSDFGSANVLARIHLAGGSLGGYVEPSAFDSFAVGNASSFSQASASMGLFYRDGLRASSETIAAGTPVEFRLRLTSTWSSTFNDIECTKATTFGQTLAYEDGSFMTWGGQQQVRIGTQTFSGSCDDSEFIATLPIGSEIQLSILYLLSGLAKSVNPEGADAGSISGLGFSINDLNTFRIFLDPVGPGYSLQTSSGNSFSSAGTPDLAPVPEPSTFLLLGTGMAMLVLRARRRAMR